MIFIYMGKVIREICLQSMGFGSFLLFRKRKKKQVWFSGRPQKGQKYTVGLQASWLPTLPGCSQDGWFQE